MFEQLKLHTKDKIVAHMPALLRFPVAVTPFSIQSLALGQGLTMLCKEAIEDGDLDFLEGRWMQLEVTDIYGCWFITNNRGVLKVTCAAPQADVRFSGKLNDFVLMMGRKEDPDTLFFQRRLVIEGDTELGLEVKNMLDSLDYDSFPIMVTRALDVCSGWVAVGSHSER